MQIENKLFVNQLTYNLTVLYTTALYFFLKENYLSCIKKTNN